VNRLVLLLTTALLVGLGTYALTRALAPAPLAREAGFDELRWLSREFKLTPAQAAAIAQLHAAYPDFRYSRPKATIFEGLRGVTL